MQSVNSGPVVDEGDTEDTCVLQSDNGPQMEPESTTSDLDDLKATSGGSESDETEGENDEYMAEQADLDLDAAAPSASTILTDQMKNTLQSSAVHSTATSVGM
jgi:hypothetical protein